MKLSYLLLATIFFTSSLMTSCEILSGEEEISCDTFINNFNDAELSKIIAQEHYQADPTTENCLIYKEKLHQYLFAIAALTTVDYCLTERQEVSGETFATLIIDETYETEQALEVLDDECPE